MGMTIPEDATRIIKMNEAVTIEELGNDEEYNDIMEDMRDESNKVRCWLCAGLALSSVSPEQGYKLQVARQAAG